MGGRLSKIGALVVATLPVVGFGLGAWAQDHRMRDHYIQQGKTSANYAAIFDGYWLYLGCLRDNCTREKESSDFIVRRANDRLRGVDAPITMKDAKR